MYPVPFLFRVCKFSVVLFSDHCDMCKKYFDKSKTEVYSVYYDDAPHSFCCKTCMNVYILANRKIVPCNWCKVRADVALCEQIDTATLGFLHSLNLYFPISVRVFCQSCQNFQNNNVKSSGMVVSSFTLPQLYIQKKKASIGMLVSLWTFGWKSGKILIFC